MTEARQIPLTEMADGQYGVVSELRGGHHAAERLHALGIRPGKKITKVGAMMMRGPITVKMDNHQVAMGHGMAGRVVVELTEP